jgi:hypothetical protein
MRRIACTVMVAVLGAALTDGTAASTRPAQAPEICDVLSPRGTGGGGNVPVDEGPVLQLYYALQEASSLSLPKSTKRELKTLLPLYEKLATGKGAKALGRLATFVEEQCGAAAGEEGGKNADVDPCEVVTQADADALAGTPLDPGVSSPAENPTRSCLYTGPVTGPVAQVEFYIGPGAKKALDIDRDLGHTITPVSGLGDEAYAEDNSIFWQQDGTWYWIRLVRLNNPVENAAPLETLAREVSDRL